MSTPTTNWLLDALSPESRDAILSQSKELPLPTRVSLQGQEEAPRYAYFMTAGIASVVVYLADGATSETAVIGREGMTGANSLLGPAVPATACFIQVEGAGYRIPLPALRDLFCQSAEIRSRILECVQQQTMTTHQIAACNNVHEAEPRLARWLLMVQDRTQLDSFNLTQEFLAEMLGARRTTVALAAGSLQRSGLIEYSRGRVTIRHGKSLRRPHAVAIRSHVGFCWGSTNLEKLSKGVQEPETAEEKPNIHG